MSNSGKEKEGAMLSQSVRDFIAFKGFVSKTRIPCVNQPSELENKAGTSQSPKNDSSSEMSNETETQAHHFR